MKIKFISHSISAITLMVAITACNTGSKEAKSEKGNDEDMGLEITKDSVRFKSSQVTEIVRGYLEIKDALIETNRERAVEASEKMLLVIESSEDAQIDVLRKDVEEISTISDIEKQREHFHSLSEKIYKIAKTSELKQGVLYRQYCPMVNDNKGGYWLSSIKEIQNPYYGDKMLTCGSVKEEL